MRMRSTFLATCLIAIVVLAGCGGGGSSKPSGFGIVDWPDSSDAKVGPEIGNRAPNFKLEQPDGSVVELASYAGNPVLINFWATWCANCREEMADLELANQGGVNVIGINLRESGERVTNLATEVGATFPMALDPKGDVTREGFRVTNLPVTVVVDGSGTIVEIVRGPVDTERIAELVAKAGGGAT